MEVSTTDTDKLEKVMTVKITEGDYKEKVEDLLKDYRRRADIPGFRKGKVPMGLIRKQYGKPILIDEVNKLIQKAVVEHIQEKELDILGDPLPREQDDIDWDKQSEFNFEVELGMSPEVDLKPLSKIKVPYHKVVQDDKTVDNLIKEQRRRMGSLEEAETVEENGALRASFTEVDKSGKAVDEGIKSSAFLLMESITGKDARKSLLGKKLGDKLTINIQKAFGKDFKVENLFEGVSEEDLENSTKLFEVEITDLKKVQLAELNQQFFDQIVGENRVSSEEEFRQAIKEDAASRFAPYSDQLFYKEAREAILDKIKFDLPERFLKNWINRKNRDGEEEVDMEEKGEEVFRDIRWQVIENAIIKEYNIEIQAEEVQQYARKMVASQMAQFGQQPDEESIISIADNLLENSEQRTNMAHQVTSEKITALLKEELKLAEKEISPEQLTEKMSQ